VPSLGIKADAIPGRLNQIGVTISRPGVYYGQCSEICGANHSFIPIAVEAVPHVDFLTWVNSFNDTTTAPSQPAGSSLTPNPADDIVRKFLEAGGNPECLNYVARKAQEIILNKVIQIVEAENRLAETKTLLPRHKDYHPFPETNQTPKELKEFLKASLAARRDPEFVRHSSAQAQEPILSTPAQVIEEPQSHLTETKNN